MKGNDMKEAIRELEEVLIKDMIKAARNTERYEHLTILSNALDTLARFEQTKAYINGELRNGV
jgi:hypothetical protein